MLAELFKELDAKRRDRFQVEARTDARRYLAQKERDDARDQARIIIRGALRCMARRLVLLEIFVDSRRQAAR